MDIAQNLGFLSIGLLLLIVLAVVWLRTRRAADPQILADKAAAEARAAEMSERISALIVERADMAARLTEAQAKLEAASGAKAAAETRQAELTLQLEKAQAAQAAAEAAREAAERRRIEHERLAALAEQKLAEQEKRIADFEQTVKQMTEAAKAATLETGKLLSSQLLETHKREAEEQKKETEQKVKQTTEGLLQQFSQITDTVSRLHQQVGESRKTIETVHRALSSPGEAGRFNEFWLENTLKHFGLEPERDFVTQFDAQDADGRRFRPDAVVFLPGDAALVIDGKASKALLELAAAEEAEEAEAANRRMAATMNQHLADLARKNYREAVARQYEKTGRGGSLRQLISIMYLPTEAAIERLYEADPDFPAKAARAEIIVAGPRTLEAAVAMAKSQITLGRQADNYQEIIKTTGLLIDSLGKVMANLRQLGTGLSNAAKAYSEVTTTVNGYLYSRANRLVGLGVKPTSAKNQPQRIPSFLFSKDDAAEIIEAEAEEVGAEGIAAEDMRRLPNPANEGGGGS